jgi:hypothetical protein
MTWLNEIAGGSGVEIHKPIRVELVHLKLSMDSSNSRGQYWDAFGVPKTKPVYLN